MAPYGQTSVVAQAIMDVFEPVAPVYRLEAGATMRQEAMLEARQTVGIQRNGQ